MQIFFKKEKSRIKDNSTYCNLLFFHYRYYTCNWWLTSFTVIQLIIISKCIWIFASQSLLSPLFIPVKKKNRLLLEPVTGGYPLLPPHIQNSPSLVSGSLCWAPAVSEPAGGPGSAFPTAWQQWKKIISITKLHIKLLVLSFDFSYAWMNLVKNNRWIKYPWLLIPPVEG